MIDIVFRDSLQGLCLELVSAHYFISIQLLDIWFLRSIVSNSDLIKIDAFKKETRKYFKLGLTYGFIYGFAIGTIIGPYPLMDFNEI